MKKFVIMFLALFLLFPIAKGVASPKTTAVRETVKIITKKFGKEVAEEGVENISKQLTILTKKYGDDVCKAVEKVGPQTGFRILNNAGEHADVVAHLLAKRGTDAVWVVSKPNRLAIFVKYGDEAGEALVKHYDAAIPIISNYGKPAAKALNQITCKSGRQLAMMEQSGDLVKIGRTPELLSVIEKYGDRGMNFIWKNKGTLCVGAVLTSFLTNPEPYINGTKELGEKTLVPVVNTIIKWIAFPFLLLFCIYFIAKRCWKYCKIVLTNKNKNGNNIN